MQNFDQSFSETLLKWKMKLEENIKMDLREGFVREACGTDSGSCSVAGLFFFNGCITLGVRGLFSVS
jgi:hypothetical protein